MDNETYDDIPVNASDVPDNFKFCKENEPCKLLSYKGKVFKMCIRDRRRADCRQQ